MLTRRQQNAIKTIKCYVMFGGAGALEYARKVLAETLAECKTEAAKQEVTAAAKQVGLE